MAVETKNTLLGGLNPLIQAVRSNRQLAQRTRDLYSECVEAFLVYAKTLAGDDPAAYTCGLVEDWFNVLGETRQPQTVHVYRKAIRLASKRLAQRAGNPSLDFAAAATCAKAKRRPPREPLTYAEALKLIGTCDDSLVGVRDRALIVTALRTGLRRGGLHALAVEGIRPPKITTVNKGGEDITLEADAETFEALAAWLRVLKKADITTGPVFREVRGKEIGRRLTPFSIWSVFNRRAKKAGIRHVFPHLARHTTVTWLREEGMTAAQVSKLTGQTESTIEDIYSHVRVQGSVAAALPSLLKKDKI